MNAILKTRDMTETEYQKRREEFIALVEEKQRRQREYAKRYKDKKRKSTQPSATEDQSPPADPCASR